jgi:subtilisin family serine protease
MYKVKYGGKKGKSIDLVESRDKVVIRTKGNKDLDSADLSRTSRELVDDTTEVAAFPEAGVTVRRVHTEAEEAGTRKRDLTRAALKGEDDIRFAGRVLEDAESGEVVLYTENFFVKFFDKTPEADCQAILDKYQLKTKSKLPFAQNAYFVEASEGTGLKVFEIAASILKEKNVEFCHPELVQERRFKSIHPLQWHLRPTSINGKPVDAHVNIENAWKITRGKGVTIAVIDDGIDAEHPEFAGRIVHPFDASMNITDPNPKTPDDNHGTACAGMACAAGLNDGASGTAPEANLMPIRLRSGLGSMAEANAFVWAADRGADVISCSWGPTDGQWWNPDDPTHRRNTPLPDSTRLAMEYALSKGRGGKGCVILFAAGNGNEDTANDGYAGYHGVIAVAACNDTGRRSVYSDYGKRIWVSFPSGDFGWKPFRHPAPISEGLRTTDRISGAGYEAGDYVNSFGGTSGACPGMAGVVALMLAVNPALTPTEVKDIIRRSCTRIDETDGEYDGKGHSIWYGFGRIDAGKAVENARALTQKPAGPSLFQGSARFSNRETPALISNGMLQTKPVRKLLGLQINLQKELNKNHRLRYKVNVPGEGILENSKDGEYAGTTDGRRRVIGLAIALIGPQAPDYTVEYAVQFKDLAEPVRGADGAWAGSSKKSGKTAEGIAITIRRK